ncbi:MAG: hypothetical protein J1E61_04465 [Lachnospiraceae bacterium]|nr:hypothetical protein [Lachnospiraceae bacterium]
MSSPNLYKYNQIVLQDSETRVIDSNERMAERIAELSKSLRDSMGDETEEDFAEDFTDGLQATQVSRLLDDESPIIKEPVYDGPSPEEILEDARMQADSMLEEAKREAEDVKNNAYEEGFANGQKAGYDKGMKEADALKEQLSREFQEKEENLTRFYQEKMRDIEPALVDTLTDVYEHIFNVDFSDNREVIVHLMRNALQQMEGSQEYLIHVSSEDFPFVSMQKSSLIEAGGAVNANFDVIEDVTLSKNQCLIETENGIFDCSLGVELKELKKELLLLSYDGKKE